MPFLFLFFVLFRSWQLVSGFRLLSKTFSFSALLQHKENFKEMDAAESQRLNRGQKDRLDYEVRKFRRRRLVKYHDLEQDLLREVWMNRKIQYDANNNPTQSQELNKRQNQLESAHSMLLRHHEMTQVWLTEQFCLF